MLVGKIKRQRHEAWRVKFETPAFWEQFFDRVPIGLTMKEYSKAQGVGYNAMHWFVESNPDIRSRYDQALKARALEKVESIDEDVRQVISGEMDANCARVVIDSKKWVAGKMDRQRWGDSKQVHLEVTDLSQMHLEAMKALSEPGVIEGEIVDDLVGDNDD